MTQFSRRAILKQMGAVGLASAVPQTLAAQNPYAELDGVPWFFLSDTEARFLSAFCDVLIPEDEFPSATQAGVIDFIDLQLATGYGQGAGLYMKGPFRRGTLSQGYQAEMVPAALIRNFIAAAIEQGGDLAAADAEQREGVVSALSETEDSFGGAQGRVVFEELWALTKEGYFGDPLYGGNRDYAGWEMVGFPGAHAYYLEFVDKNVPYRAPPKGIGHIPGTNRSASLGASAMMKKEG
ncbi:gluconate 2-dehydrogenase subunit 3 family protein [Marivita sp.]|uniref:gluconate 2-dehydrogenase subunit 3 family protein n=1 Tax=Marivita sp. TaxID=2003365 RepID=UPI0025BA8EFE|nr:gluconate 2-dehydrogenase subunit 3 family protein [Marivita sp.]